MLRSATDQGIGFVAQGNSSAAAAALIEALDKHNAARAAAARAAAELLGRRPDVDQRALQPWHFRFDAHADMRLAALIDVLRADASLKKVYLIGQDYSFGQHVLKQARAMLAAKRPDIEIVGDELHPLGRVKDFLPYAAKIQASGAQAVLTGNWGNDLTLLVQGGARGRQRRASFYTFYGNALGAPAAIGEAGVGAVLCGGRVASERRWRGVGRVLRRLPAALSRAARRLRAPAHAGAGRDAGRGDRARRQRRGGARWRVRCRARASMRARSAVCTPRRCARPTTSCSSRWWSA